MGPAALTSPAGSEPTMSTIISITNLGAHAIGGQFFPVCAELQKVSTASGRSRYTVSQVCNGKVHTSETFQLRRDAQTYLESLIRAYSAA